MTSVDDSRRVTAEVSPIDTLQILSRAEMAQLGDAHGSKLFETFRRCALAVLNSGRGVDDTSRVLKEYANFDVEVIQRERGIKLLLTDAPARAFVDGSMIHGIREHLFSVLRDVVFEQTELHNISEREDKGAATTDAVFSILRHANALVPDRDPNLVVCWGGHSTSREEYDFAKSVGYEFGLRGLDICTGCGAGAMKAPMKGATIAHSKQRNTKGRYIGISEPGIIAAESPNPIVNELIVMPDIEKRLEAFVRLGHGILVFPGGVGTMEEILYILGILLCPENKDSCVPLFLAGPHSSREYFDRIDAFIGDCLGPEAQARYEVVTGDAAEISRRMAAAMDDVKDFRRATKDAYYFNWTLHIPLEFQEPFIPTHENMATLKLSRDLGAFELAVNLRCMFSGLVAGNVKAEGLEAVARHGNYQINGEPGLLKALDELLVSFADQGRMKINAADYSACYEIVS